MTKPTLIALVCVLIFTAYTVMPVLQSMAEQKAIGDGYPGTLLVHFFVFLVEAVIIFLLVRYVANRLLSKKAPPKSLTDYR
jgi:hypothetical protein